MRGLKHRSLRLKNKMMRGDYSGTGAENPRVGRERGVFDASWVGQQVGYGFKDGGGVPAHAAAEGVGQISDVGEDAAEGKIVLESNSL